MVFSAAMTAESAFGGPHDGGDGGGALSEAVELEGVVGTVA